MPWSTQQLVRSHQDRFGQGTTKQCDSIPGCGSRHGCARTGWCTDRGWPVQHGLCLSGCLSCPNACCHHWVLLVVRVLPGMRMPADFCALFLRERLGSACGSRSDLVCLWVCMPATQAQADHSLSVSDCTETGGPRHAGTALTLVGRCSHQSGCLCSACAAAGPAAAGWPPLPGRC